ncbi:hypothetical protein O7635_22185 [Asanoa sp. WMMD1127]|uniref:hypothetical protein n=1 Tax=Asanoa sp. WMMD1127 TaxID=3016107 RepID=UPI002416939F|nr:hypothetical protein [Asanoa sp. WMMD1127]MDG4824567.1 hypothetical protein [Asanoa sp. WMMD1127]
MRSTARLVLVTGAVGGALVGVVRAARRTGAGNGWRSPVGTPDVRPRWHVATVARPADQVMPDGRPPEPLADLGDSVEVQVRPAPGDKGTELAVRLRDGDRPGPLARLRGEDPDQHLRRALREAKALLEGGEVVLPSRPATTERTLLNRPLEWATTHGREEGLR